MTDTTFSMPPTIEPRENGLVFIKFCNLMNFGDEIGNGNRVGFLTTPDKADALKDLARQRVARGDPLRASELRELTNQYIATSGEMLAGPEVD